MKIAKKIAVVFGFVSLALIGAVPAQANLAPAPGSSSIAQILVDTQFTELVKALVKVELVEVFLNGGEQFTVFAPTNEAFQNLYSALGVTGIDDLSDQIVRNVLLYHVVEGRRAANSLLPKQSDREVETLTGQYFFINSSGRIQDVGGRTANIILADISASNGIIHVVDSVLIPNL